MILGSPVDLVIVGVVVLLVFGPKIDGPRWRWKPETNEDNRTPKTAFAEPENDLLVNRRQK